MTRFPPFRAALRLTVFCLAAAAGLPAATAAAQSAPAQPAPAQSTLILPAPVPTGPGEPMFKREDVQTWFSRNDLDITVGAGVGLAPRFEGAKAYGPQFLPYIDASWRDRVFLSTDDGLGVNLLNSNGFYTGPFVWISDGRRAGSSNHLAGLSDVETVAIGGFFARYEFNDAFDVFGRVHRDLEQNRHGLTADFGAELDLPVTSSVIAGLKSTLTWAQGDALQPYFGITPQESQASGYPAFSPGSGWRDVTVEPSLTFLLDDHWALTGLLTYERLLPAVNRSPLVTDQGSANQVSFGLILSYHF